jgi:MoxR-like ATPase
MQEDVIRDGILGGILGPPGTGKSSAAFAFAATLNRNDWVVHMDAFRCQ